MWEEMAEEMAAVRSRDFRRKKKRLSWEKKEIRIEGRRWKGGDPMVEEGMCFS
jgi:hypothetical protein